MTKASALGLVVILSAGLTACSSSTSSAIPRPSPSSSIPAPSTTVEATTTPTRLRPNQVAAALYSMTGADPVLLPAAIPADWTAVVSVTPSTFEVTYTGLHGETVQLSIVEANPPPPLTGSTQRTGFRGDAHGLYQQDVAADPTAERYVIWNEPGRWAGDPHVGIGATHQIPYFMFSTGLNDPAFQAIANSLSPIPHAPFSSTSG